MTGFASDAGRDRPACRALGDRGGSGSSGLRGGVRPSCVRNAHRLASMLVLMVVGLFVLAILSVSLSSEATPAAGSPRQLRAAPTTDASGVHWLCRPGIMHNPCLGDLTTTVVQADGKTRIVRAHSAADPPIDCFYVYPTASTQDTPNASFVADKGVIAAAQLQAERFSQVCRVYAPLYRQLTITGLTQTGVIGAKPPPGTPPANFTEPYADVASAWGDYLANYNHGRGVVLIGHSQGSFQLIQLVHQKIETIPGVLRRIVSAILPGGNVEVSASGPGSTFTHLGPCRSTKQIHCVVAYSTFPSMPPAGATFGRTSGPAAGASSTTSIDSVVCTNPGALSGGTADLATYFPANQNLLVGGLGQPRITTPWVAYLNLFRGTCRDNDGASWLQVDVAKPGDHRPHPIEALGAGWGYHLDDINLPLGNLVRLVCLQGASYMHEHRTCPVA